MYMYSSSKQQIVSFSYQRSPFCDTAHYSSVGLQKRTDILRPVMSIINILKFPFTE